MQQPNHQANPNADLSVTYDAIIVGSGAAGGMATWVLANHGLKVLLLEAGKQQDLTKELHSMEWPYNHQRRGMLPPGDHALSAKEYSFRKPPYAKGMPYNHVYSYVENWNGADYSKNIVVDEKQNPFTGSNYAWVRARLLGGKTAIWGRLALRLSDYDFKAASRDGFGIDWPVSYADVEPYYDKVDRLLGIGGHAEGLDYLPDSIFQRSPRLNAAEIMLRESMLKSGKVLTPYRPGVMTDQLPHAKYRTHCFGRGACGRHVGGCDINAAFSSPSALIFPAMDTGNVTLRTNATVYEVTVDPKTGKASGISFVDSVTRKTYQAKGKAVLLGASTLETARLMLLSKSRQYPNGIGNSSGHVGHNFCEHLMGPSVTGLAKNLVGKPRTIDDGRPGGFYVPRFRNLKTKSSKFIRAYGFEGGAGTTMIPGAAFSTSGFGAEYKRKVREQAGAYIEMGGFGEMLPRYENYVEIDPNVKDAWGVPVLKFHIQFGDNEKAMAADMADAAKEIFEEAGIEILSTNREVLTEGWSIHELGTARMGNDPKTSVVNSFQQSHEVKNLLVIDGSTHASASCQNPTWTIMALCWRSCDHLADQLKKGEV